MIPCGVGRAEHEYGVLSPRGMKIPAAGGGGSGGGRASRYLEMGGRQLRQKLVESGVFADVRVATTKVCLEASGDPHMAPLRGTEVDLSIPDTVGLEARADAARIFASAFPPSAPACFCCLKQDVEGRRDGTPRPTDRRPGPAYEIPGRTDLGVGHGEGVAQNAAKAAQMYCEAARLGDAEGNVFAWLDVCERARCRVPVIHWPVPCLPWLRSADTTMLRR